MKGFSGKGKGSKGQNSTSNVVRWNCGKTGHYARNCSVWWWSTGKGKGRSETGAQVTNMLVHGLGMKSMLMGCGKRQTGRQELVQDGGREQTIGHHGNQKNQWAELCSTALKDAAARTLKEVKSRKRAKVTGAEGVRRHPDRCQHRNCHGRPARSVRRVRRV